MSNSESQEKNLRQKWDEFNHNLELALKYQKKSRNHLEASLNVLNEYKQAMKKFTSTYSEEEVFKAGLADLLLAYNLYEKMTSERAKSLDFDRSSVTYTIRAYQSWNKISLDEFLTIPGATQAKYDETENVMNEVLSVANND